MKVNDLMKILTQLKTYGHGDTEVLYQTDQSDPFSVVSVNNVKLFDNGFETIGITEPVIVFQNDDVFGIPEIDAFTEAFYKMYDEGIIKIDNPKEPNGIYYLEITADGKTYGKTYTTVSYQLNVGFGFWDDDHIDQETVYGTKPTFIITDIDHAVKLAAEQIGLEVNGPEV